MFEGDPNFDVIVRYEGRRMQVDVAPHGHRTPVEAERHLREANGLYLWESAPRCSCIVGLPYLVDEGDLPGAPAVMTRLGASEGPYVTEEPVNIFYDSASMAIAGLDVAYLLTKDSYLGLVKVHDKEALRDRVSGLTLPTTPAFTTHRSPELPDDLVEFLLEACEGFLYSAGDGTELVMVGEVQAATEFLGDYLRIFAKVRGAGRSP